MNKYLISQDKQKCCGCSACVVACPTHCISMTKDEDGFLFPQISYLNLCINCGRCSQVCPIETGVTTVKTELYYAGYNLDRNVIQESSSGGVFPAFANYVLEHGGVVFGAELNKNHQLNHVFIEGREDLKRIRGSKYIQSDVRNTYRECKEFLDANRLVFFTGTPCQIQGLKNFLKKEYENLYTADVICHGIPSQMMFDAYVNFLENKHKAKLVDINFRDKTRNGWSITLRYTMLKKNGSTKDYFLISKLSEYFTAFLRGGILRESCYCCPFASMKRAGDMTMGDFWGYQKTRPELKHEEGLSLLLINNKKGEKIVEVLEKRNVVFTLLDEDNIKQSENKNLYIPTKRPEYRNLVYDELRNNGFKYIAKKYFRHSHTWRNILKNNLPVSIVKSLTKK